MMHNYGGINGGALALSGSSLGWVYSSTVAYNYAGDGGGISVNGLSNVYLVNSTVTNNQAESRGGAMFLGFGPVNVFNSTFAHNIAPHGSEFYVVEPKHYTFYNTILACLAESSSCTDGPGSGGLVLFNSILETGTLADFGLAELADNGGPTQTMALLPDSPLIDAGDDTACEIAPVGNLDQRGVARPQGSHCDISAYEDQPLVRFVKVDTQTFGDVSEIYWAWTYIERLYAAGITGGCSANPLQYCPETIVTRDQMAVFLLRGIHGSDYTPPAVGSSTGFADVPTGYWAAAWIKQLAAEGITGGCGSGNFCPEDPVTRDQMAVFLLKAKHGRSYTPPVVGASTGFADVPASHWAAAWIRQLVADGITAGCGNGNYCPGQPVNRAQMAVFLVKTFNLP